MTNAERGEIALSLLRSGIRLLPDLIDSDCGNCEDTPCDDARPSYLCKGHRWLKEVRKLSKGAK
jgi:hypothetical protein